MNTPKGFNKKDYSKKKRWWLGHEGLLSLRQSTIV